MKIWIVLITFSVFVSCLEQSHADKATASSSLHFVLISDVKWEDLNPARGDQSPKAANLWNYRTKPGPSGFLLRPVDGFRSPPHIHNTAYRGVVISGLLHNDDPQAADMWMGVGSFWTQPAGEVHITAAKGSDVLAYIEVEEDFRVLSAEDKFSHAERPINVYASNIVWLDASNTLWIDVPRHSKEALHPEIAFLWGVPKEKQLNGTLLKLPPGFKGTIDQNGSLLRVVVIQGSLEYHLSNADTKTLETGSYFGSTKKSRHAISAKSTQSSLIYLRTYGTFKVIAEP